MRVPVVSTATVDGRAAWVVAGVSLVILTIAYGAPLFAAVALKPIAAEFGTDRAAPAAAGAFALIGAAFGGIAAGWLAGRFGIRIVVLFGATMIAAGLASFGVRRPRRSLPGIRRADGPARHLLHLLAGHDLCQPLVRTQPRWR